MTAILFGFMILYALSFTMIAPMLGGIIDQYGLSLSEAGLVASAQSVGGLLAALAGGFFADRFSKARQLAAYFSLYGLALAALFFEPSFIQMLVLFFVIGAATRLVDTISNAITADLHESNRGLWLNLLHGFFAAGALVGPLFARLVLGRGLSWNAGFGLLGLACLGALGLFLPMLRPMELRLSAAGASADAAPWRVARSGRIWLLAAMMFFYVGNQVCFTLWLPLYMEKQLGASPDFGGLALSLFWLGILAGRLAAVLAGRRIRPGAAVLYGSLAGSLAMGAGLAAGSPIGLAVGGFFSGAAAAGVIPYLIAIGSAWFPASSGSVSSLLFLSSSFARMLLPYLLGLVAERFGFPAGMAIPVASLAAAAALMLLLEIRGITRYNSVRS